MALIIFYKSKTACLRVSGMAVIHITCSKAYTHPWHPLSLNCIGINNQISYLVKTHRDSEISWQVARL